MKNDEFSKSVERVISVKLQAVDRFLEKVVEPLSDVGNPEKLIKKPYAQWTPEDLIMLTKIYGQGENTLLTRTIFNREFEKVKQLEAEVE